VFYFLPENHTTTVCVIEMGLAEDILAGNTYDPVQEKYLGMHRHPCDACPPNINNRSEIQSGENNVSENMPNHTR
jgi:hypothetical protein